MQCTGRKFSIVEWMVGTQTAVSDKVSNCSTTSLIIKKFRFFLNLFDKVQFVVSETNDNDLAYKICKTVLLPFNSKEAFAVGDGA